MPCITLPLDPVGPMIEIGIAAASQSPTHAPDAEIQWIRAIADTGCTHTSIHSSVAEKLKLSIVSKGTSNTPAGSVDVSIYLADLYLRPIIGGKPFNWRLGTSGFLELRHALPTYDALLGMDVLNQGIFVVNGALKHASFCW